MFTTLITAARTVVSTALLLTSSMTSPAPAPHEIHVVASNFQFEPASIRVTAGERVRLVLRSSDGTHGFAIPGLKIDALLGKGGEAVVVEFTAPAPGTYEVACSEFCGRGHGHMKATLISVGPPRRTDW
jgi:cytochrome c oxidase subunit 2